MFFTGVIRLDGDVSKSMPLANYCLELKSKLIMRERTHEELTMK